MGLDLILGGTVAVGYVVAAICVNVRNRNRKR